jgi:hypothetical protein
MGTTDSHINHSYTPYASVSARFPRLPAAKITLKPSTPNENTREMRDCARYLAAISTPHSLYSTTICINAARQQACRHGTRPTHAQTESHTKHNSHKSPIIPPPYTTRHTLIALRTSLYSQSCHNIATPAQHRHTNPTQTTTAYQNDWGRIVGKGR